MKYVHGTDEKKHDLLMVWVNRLMLCLFVVVLLFFAILFIGIFISLLFCGGSPLLILALVFVLISSVAIVTALLETVWCNARYHLNLNGITIIYPLRTKFYPWNSFKRVFIAPLWRAEKATIAYEYIILMISERNPFTHRISAPECWKYRSSFLIIRSTEKRIQEMKKYCIISDVSA